MATRTSLSSSLSSPKPLFTLDRYNFTAMAKMDGCTMFDDQLIQAMCVI